MFIMTNNKNNNDNKAVRYDQTSLRNTTYQSKTNQNTSEQIKVNFNTFHLWYEEMKRR